MANIVINSRFNPYTYDEMLKPALMETQAHQDVENNLSDLATKSNVWEEMTNKETDPQAYNMYKNYSNDLQNKAAQLAAQGLNPNSRQNMLQMKQRYTKEIVPIEQAYTKRSQLADEQRKMQAQDNTTLFDRSAANMSLDELIKNPNVTSVVQSGKDIEKRASDAFSHFAKDLKDDPTKYKHVMGGQYWEKVQRLGYRPEDIREAIMNDPNSSWALTEMRGQLLKTVPKEILSNPANESKILNHINIGMASAIGTGDTKTVKDTDHDEFLKERLFRSRQKEPTNSIPQYTSVDNLTINGKVKTSEIADKIKFLDTLKEQLKSNPKLNLLHEEEKDAPKTITVGGMAGIRNVDPNAGKMKYKPTLERIQAAGEEVGIKYTEDKKGNIIDQNGKPLDLGKLYNALGEQLKTSAVRDRTYHSNITDDDLTRKYITTNSAILYADKGTTGIYEYDKGVKRKMLNQDDFNNYTTKGLVPTFNFADREHPIKIVATDKDNKTHSMVLDPKVIDDSDNSLALKIKSIQNSLDNHKREDAKIKIDDVMEQIRAKFNTLAESQKKTLSNKELNAERY